MTATQRLRLIGFNASLKQRGVLFTFGTGQEVTALVEPMTAEGGEFALSNDERTAASILVLQDALHDVPVQKGDVWWKAGISYRVVDVENHPDNPVVRLTVELGQPTP